MVFVLKIIVLNDTCILVFLDYSNYRLNAVLHYKYYGTQQKFYQH